MNSEQVRTEIKCPYCKKELIEMKFFSLKTPLGNRIVNPCVFKYFKCENCNKIFYMNIIGELNELPKQFGSTIVLIDLLISTVFDELGKVLRDRLQK